MFRHFISNGHKYIPVHAKRNLSTIAKRYYAIRAPPPPPPKQTNTPSVPAMLAVASMGFAAYWQLVKSREGKTMPRRKEYTTVEEEEALRQKRLEEVQAKRGRPLKPIPAFSPDEVTVVFFVGGPGAGKRTQSEKLAKEYGFVHLSVGDLLRTELEKGERSKYKDVVTEYILREKLTVPMEATIPLLEEAMRAAIAEGKPARFLIDGFPRKLDQAIKFEEMVVSPRLMIHFECPETVMLQRSVAGSSEEESKAGATHNNDIEMFKRRLNMYQGSAEPVFEKFEKENKLRKITCDQPIDKVSENIKSLLVEQLDEKKTV
ncbi:adenylate kinase-domain-containing protein [Mycotypha africana]|uniref:adenylate kinase-domain-containing protein n=1 Tax=Mycotypha africana TaxID=64632 RepID=UPI002301C9B7|nr:adenylate kinase-domain-containing protein [Mycotypha africana]KAI8977134.1 adenylate kinase-domain-containing protein [Mycotypha africana]